MSTTRTYTLAISEPFPSQAHGLTNRSFLANEENMEMLFDDGAEKLVLLVSYPSPGPINRFVRYISKP